VQRKASSGFGNLPDNPDWTTTMRMSSTRILAVIVLAIVVLLTAAEFGPALLSGR
jgi:hypothetical protein